MKKDPDKSRRASRADEIEIRWPSGVRQVLKNVRANETHIIMEHTSGTGP